MNSKFLAVSALTIAASFVMSMGIALAQTASPSPSPSTSPSTSPTVSPSASPTPDGVGGGGETPEGAPATGLGGS